MKIRFQDIAESAMVLDDSLKRGYGLYGCAEAVLREFAQRQPKVTYEYNIMITMPHSECLYDHDWRQDAEDLRWEMIDLRSREERRCTAFDILSARTFRIVKRIAAGEVEEV